MPDLDVRDRVRSEEGKFRCTRSYVVCEAGGVQNVAEQGKGGESGNRDREMLCNLHVSAVRHISKFSCRV